MSCKAIKGAETALTCSTDFTSITISGAFNNTKSNPGTVTITIDGFKNPTSKLTTDSFWI